MRQNSPLPLNRHSPTFPVRRLHELLPPPAPKPPATKEHPGHGPQQGGTRGTSLTCEASAALHRHPERHRAERGPGCLLRLTMRRGSRYVRHHPPAPPKRTTPEPHHAQPHSAKLRHRGDAELWRRIGSWQVLGYSNDRPPVGFHRMERPAVNPSSDPRSGYVSMRIFPYFPVAVLT